MHLCTTSCITVCCFGFLVSKKNRGAASVGEIKTKNLVLSNELIKVELPP